MNGLSSLNESDREYPPALLMTWLDSEGQGHSRPSRWWRHPCQHCGVEVHSVLLLSFCFSYLSH